MGKKGGAKYSPMSNPELQYSIEDPNERAQYLLKTMHHVLQFQKTTMVKNDNEAQERIATYFITCAENGIRPIYEECALCLGTTRQSLWEWETGKYKGPVSPATIKRTKEILAAFDARAAIENKMNPVLYFFRAKNYYGMKDQMDYVVTPNLEAPDRDKLIADAELLPDD